MVCVIRKEPLAVGEVYHLMNKSIEGYTIFNSDADYSRMLRMLRFFQADVDLGKFSQFMQRQGVTDHGFESYFRELSEGSPLLLDIVAYCLMPTHIHVVARQTAEGGISRFMSKALNAYARFFNTRYRRRGPLWVGSFKSVRATTDEQLAHLTRYVHLNPTTARLVKKPEYWEWSSFQEYIDPVSVEHPLCDYQNLLGMDANEYRRFVQEYVVDQADLVIIKSLVLD